LYSVQKAVQELDAEVIVVDNASTDGGIDYLRSKFAGVKFICSETNLGFAKACNKGLSHASGQYILFLNPDTLVAEDSFHICIKFFKAHADCGAVGVKMLDGSGKFLKESKRSFPSPSTSFYKLLGLSALFPASKIFSRYHLGHLDKNKDHEVDVLAGAFMMIRKEALDKTGAFDEVFFMYGEDIDLSYRIQKAGYKNYYVSQTGIIHFKGESTKRGSLNYVRMFYNAMSVFVKKHYGSTKAGVFNAFIQLAISIRAFIATGFKLTRWVGLPFIDALFILLSFWLVKEVWTSFIKPDLVFPDKLLLISFPAFTLVYLITAYYAGLYDRYYRTSGLVRATLIATLVLLALYAMLPEKFRFSRGVVVFGAFLTFILISLLRTVLLKAKILKQSIETVPEPYMLIVAPENEFGSVKNFFDQKKMGDKIIGRVSIEKKNLNAVASIDAINSAAKALNAKEIIFCAGGLSYKEIISRLPEISSHLRKRFKAYRSESIVGSDNSATSGETFSDETHINLVRATNRRAKRLTDVITAIFFLITFPIHLVFVKRPLSFFRNCLQVLSGSRTWIGYLTNYKLPLLRPGVLGSNGLYKNGDGNLPQENLQQLDHWYARNYEPLQDIKIIWKNYKYLGG